MYELRSQVQTLNKMPHVMSDEGRSSHLHISFKSVNMKNAPHVPCLFYMNGREFVIGNKCGKMGISDGLDIFKSFGFKELIEFMES
jgi:hypothetical protein